jgi:hypothetical protein
VFLSGNGPLVEVLQYELRNAGGGGKAFVRGVKDYVATYSRKRSLVPPEHVLIFDEAQRAFDADMVRSQHKDKSDPAHLRSEPEHFIEFAERIPDWCVVIGLIGNGQEIHVGEEAGLVQWRWAVERAARPGDWTVHTPLQVADVFEGGPVASKVHPTLNLDTEIRFHHAKDLHAYVAGLLAAEPSAQLRLLAERLEREGFHWRLTRSLATAANGRGYKKGAKVRDPRQLRINAYRVLLTRGRDACVVFVPPMAELDGTFAYLRDSGFREL